MKNNEKVADAFMAELVLYGVMAPGAEDALRMAFERMPALGNGSIFKDDGEAVARVLWDDKAAGTVKITMIAVESPPVGAFLYTRGFDTWVDEAGRTWVPCGGYERSRLVKSHIEMMEELELSKQKVKELHDLLDGFDPDRADICIKACDGISNEKLESWLSPPEGQVGAPHGPWTSHIVELNKEVMEKIAELDAIHRDLDMENLKSEFCSLIKSWTPQWDDKEYRWTNDTTQLEFLQFIGAKIFNSIKAAHE